MRALIVEDDELMRSLFETVVSERGHDIVSCGSGEQAWGHCRQRPFDLVILDWMLPGMDGLSLCRRIRSLEHGQQSIILVVTAMREAQALEDVLRAGADDYLRKPVDVDRLGVRLAIAESRALGLTGRRLVESAGRDSERRLATLLDQAPVGLVEVDPDGRVILAQGRALEPAESATSDWLGEPLAGRLGPTADAALRDSLRGEPCRAAAELGQRSLDVLWTPIYDAEGEVAGATGVLAPRAQDGSRDSAHPAQGVDSRRRGATSALIGDGPAMQRVIQQIIQVASVDWTVLLEGETGTGKELVARALHEASPRADHPFLAVNCAGLTESLLASQLFGHRRGAFTGASSDQAGVFEAAHRGTLLLDEFGDIAPTVQVNLLRVLESREFTRIGETKPRTADVRVIASTNRDLRKMVADGEFRADLYYRVRVVRISLPPLRERIEDIPALAGHFLDAVGATLGRSDLSVSDEAMALLYRYHWPGNVRELKGSIDVAALRCDGIIRPDDLPPEVLEPHPEDAESASGVDEARRLLEVLERAGGNRAKAARLLGVSRATLYRRMARFGIDVD